MHAMRRDLFRKVNSESQIMFRYLLPILLAVLAIGLLFVDANAAACCMVGAVTTYQWTDGQLSVTRALPSGASAVTSNAIDTGEGATGTFVVPCELQIDVPAVTTAMLADAATIKYDIVTSAASDLSNPVTIAKEVIVQTGAGGAGAAAQTARFALPSNVLRYVGVKATKSATGDASTVSLTVALKF